MNKDQRWHEEQYWNWASSDYNSNQWFAKREAYIPGAKITRNLPYGDSPDEVFDLFSPQISPNQTAPTLIFILMKL